MEGGGSRIPLDPACAFAYSVWRWRLPDALRSELCSVSTDAVDPRDKAIGASSCRTEWRSARTQAADVHAAQVRLRKKAEKQLQKANETIGKLDSRCDAHVMRVEDIMCAINDWNVGYT